jgi:transposase
MHAGSAVLPDEAQTSGSGRPEMTEPAARVMSAKEMERLRVVQLVLEHRLTRVKAGQALGISARQVARLCGAFQREGETGLISRKRGRVGNRKLPSAIEAQVVELARQFYRDLGPTLVRQKLAERHGIRLAKETVRKILSKVGLWQPKNRPPQENKPDSTAT